MSLSLRLSLSLESAKRISVDRMGSGTSQTSGIVLGSAAQALRSSGKPCQCALPGWELQHHPAAAPSVSNGDFVVLFFSKLLTSFRSFADNIHLSFNEGLPSAALLFLHLLGFQGPSSFFLNVLNYATIPARPKT